MQSRRARLIVFVVLVVVGVVAGVMTWELQRRAAEVTAAQRDLDARLERMIAATRELGVAQQAYVAPGQPDDAWFARVSSLVQQLSDDIAAVAARARSAETGGILQSATESVAGLVQLDTDLRENLRVGQELIAADLIFADGRKALDAIATPLHGVRNAERAASDNARAALLSQAWTTVGAAALVWLMGLTLLVRLPAPAASPRSVPAPTSPTIDTPLTPEPIVQPRAPVDLDVAADVCVAISRMTAGVELPHLLARVAAVLDASGIIVWMTVAEELVAVTSHGYDPRVIARLGSIGKNADNATAASWQSGEVKVVPGDIISNGAVVAPMFRPDGCIGVLAAEVRHARENDADTRAVTAMIAAQLAAVLGAGTLSGAREAGEGGRAASV